MLKSHYTHTLCAFFLSLYCPLKLLVESGNHENTFHIKTFTRNSPNVARELFGFFHGTCEILSLSVERELLALLVQLRHEASQVALAFTH